MFGKMKSDYTIKIEPDTDKGETEEGAKKLAKQLGRQLTEDRFITVKELEDEFDIKKSTQQLFRDRSDNPLPYYQLGEKGKILYSYNEVVDWIKTHKIK